MPLFQPKRRAQSCRLVAVSNLSMVACVIQLLFHQYKSRLRNSLSPTFQGADAATSFSSANSSALPSSSAQAAKPPASFAQVTRRSQRLTPPASSPTPHPASEPILQVAAEKAKAPPVAPKATALSSGQQQALKAPTSSSASSSSSSAAAAAAASSNAAGAQASGQAVLRMRGLP